MNAAASVNEKNSAMARARVTDTKANKERAARVAA
jgi:hypothetical protein